MEFFCGGNDDEKRIAPLPLLSHIIIQCIIINIIFFLFGIIINIK